MANHVTPNKVFHDRVLYERVANEVVHLIEGGTLRAGSRVPSVRNLSNQRGVSVSTVLQAYRQLENGGWIEARPQSGYYVKSRQQRPPEPEESRPSLDITQVSTGELMMQILQDKQSANAVQLGSAIAASEHLPIKALHRALMNASKKYGADAMNYDIAPGCLRLREQIARRVLVAGCNLTPDDFVLTNGCQEALMLCLRAVTKSGDTVLIESPTYYGVLQIIESLGLNALEIPTHPRDGISLEAMEVALDGNAVAACVLSPTFNNPLGSCMSDERKKRLVETLSARDIPLIEDDIWGDTSFDNPRPHAAKAWDKNGGVMLCSSFSKTLAPGLRVGYVAAGRWKKRVEYLKTVNTLANATLPSLAVAEFLENGGYDAHLRRIRKSFAAQVQWTTNAVDHYFPAGTRVTRPRGGQVVWVEMPQNIDALQLFADAIKENISIAPGPIFSPRAKFRNFFRLNCAWHQSPEIERAFRTLGSLMARQMG